MRFDQRESALDIEHLAKEFWVRTVYDSTLYAPNANRNIIEIAAQIFNASGKHSEPVKRSDTLHIEA